MFFFQDDYRKLTTRVYGVDSNILSSVIFQSGNNRQLIEDQRQR